MIHDRGYEYGFIISGRLHVQAGFAHYDLADRDLALPVQVLQEFYVQATRASRPDPITRQQAVRLRPAIIVADDRTTRPDSPAELAARDARPPASGHHRPVCGPA
jgi:hypothetical protein